MSDSKPQFGLAWLFAAITVLVVLMAVAATNGGAIVAVVVVGIFAPTFVLLWIAATWLRDQMFGMKSEPLASSLRDPLGFNDRNTNQLGHERPDTE